MKLVDALTPLGACVDFSIAPPSRLDYIKHNIPKEINFNSFQKIFKKDIFIDNILERVSDVDVYYIRTSQGRGDELYYFAHKGKIFHGEKIWTHYHGFYQHLKQIKPSAVVELPSWFIGSKNNYTHQLLDCTPGLIYKVDHQDRTSTPPIINVFGSPNSIIESLKELPLLQKGLNSPVLFLESLGHPNSVGNWEIRCIRFNSLYLMRHISIFKAFSLLDKAFASCFQGLGETAYSEMQDFLYLSRSDKRIINQDDIKEFLALKHNATVIENISELNYRKKRQCISQFKRLLLPPGSDNINGLCFSDQSAILIQMISSPIASILDSPFTSFAGFRYLLPFLHRVILLPSIKDSGQMIPYSGEWNIASLEELINVFR